MKNYFEMYKTVWGFHKKYIECASDTDEFWKAAIKESHEIAKQYGECSFIIGLLLAELNEFEEVIKNGNIEIS